MIAWTQAMDVMLGTDTDRAVAAVLGISVDSVDSRRYSLGIPRFIRNERFSRPCGICGQPTKPRAVNAVGPFYCSKEHAGIGRRGRRVPERECSQPGCSFLAHAKMLCSTCYSRRRTGRDLNASKPTSNMGRLCSEGTCGRPAYCKMLCTYHYNLRRNPRAERPPRDAEWFWSNVDRSGGHDACWPWLRAIAKGYGHLGAMLGQPQQAAHRVAWFLNGNAIPGGHNLDHVCHTQDYACSGGDSCRHRRCCNPAHLEVVTVAENNRRAAQQRSRRPCSRGHDPVRRDNQGRCVQCRRESDVPDIVRQFVLVRCNGICEACGELLGGTVHIHHRRRRSQGGKHVEANLVALHPGCHINTPQSVHRNPAWACGRGLLVGANEDPETVALVLSSGRRVLLQSSAAEYFPAPGMPYDLNVQRFPLCGNLLRSI